VSRTGPGRSRRSPAACARGGQLIIADYLLAPEIGRLQRWLVSAALGTTHLGTLAGYREALERTSFAVERAEDVTQQTFLPFADWAKQDRYQRIRAEARRVYGPLSAPLVPLGYRALTYSARRGAFGLHFLTARRTNR